MDEELQWYHKIIEFKLITFFFLKTTPTSLLGEILKKWTPYHERISQQQTELLAHQQKHNSQFQHGEVKEINKYPEKFSVTETNKES